MNEEERYLFDLWGYLVVEDVLSKAVLAELTHLIRHQYDAEPNNEDIYSQRFGGFLQLESDAFSESTKSIHELCHISRN